jgi:hypothetical protein
MSVFKYKEEAIKQMNICPCLVVYNPKDTTKAFRILGITASEGAAFEPEQETEDISGMGSIIAKTRGMFTGTLTVTCNNMDKQVLADFGGGFLTASSGLDPTDLSKGELEFTSQPHVDFGYGVAVFPLVVKDDNTRYGTVANPWALYFPNAMLEMTYPTQNLNETDLNKQEYVFTIGGGITEDEEDVSLYTGEGVQLAGTPERAKYIVPTP